MAGVNDLIEAGMPWLATETLHGTADTDWKWTYNGIVDNAGTLVSFSGCTITAKVYDSAGTLILTATGTSPSAGTIECSAPRADTAPFTPPFGTTKPALHEVAVVTAGSQRFLVVGAGGGVTVIHADLA